MDESPFSLFPHNYESDFVVSFSLKIDTEEKYSRYKNTKPKPQIIQLTKGSNTNETGK